MVNSDERIQVEAIFQFKIGSPEKNYKINNMHKNGGKKIKN